MGEKELSNRNLALVLRIDAAALRELGDASVASDLENAAAELDAQHIVIGNLVGEKLRLTDANANLRTKLELQRDLIRSWRVLLVSILPGVPASINAQIACMLGGESTS